MMWSPRSLFNFCSVVLPLVWMAAPARAQPCEWAGGFNLPGMRGAVFAVQVYDDRMGPALYAGGVFTTAGDVLASNIAKWDGAAWSALGSGMNGIVYALGVYDDGTGPALYAGGVFTTAGGA